MTCKGAERQKVTVQVVGRASRLSWGRLALGRTSAGKRPGPAGETPAPLPEQLRQEMWPTGRLLTIPQRIRVLCRWMALLLLLCEAGAATSIVELDPASGGRVFEGIGAVSAGASTRLLVDYPEPQRSQILDFLFKPKFGAGFQHLKVEIGSGENSTCGSEPSHVVMREELADPKPRGYEFWLMAEARKRNAEIILDCLPWAYPHWVGDRFSQESAEWFTAFLEVARKQFGLELNWISAAQNEMGTDLNWIRKNLRPTLDARGFSKVKLQAPDDDSEYWEIFDALEKDPAVDRLIGAVGYHYVDGREPWQIDQKAGRDAAEKAKRSGKPLWASEEWSQSGGQWGDKGALYVEPVPRVAFFQTA